MKKKLKTFFTTNIALKIVSLVLGFVLWAVLAYYQDPIITSTVSVPITYLNADLLRTTEGLVMMSGPSSVQLTVSTKTSKSSDADSSMFTCYADLTDHNGGDLGNQRVHITVNQIGGDEVVLDWNYARNDPNITVVMDRFITKEFKVELLPTDSMTEGLILGDSVTFDPETISVSGPETRFTNLASVKALFSLSDLTEGEGGVFTKDITVNLYDANDKVIQNTDNRFSLSQTNVTMTAIVSRIRSTSVKSMGTVGEVAEGYRYVTSTISPDSLTVYGLKSTIADLTEVTIPASAIDITGLTGDKTYEINILEYLPEGVSLVDATKETVNVTVHVEKLVTKKFTLTENDLIVNGKKDGFEYTIEPFSYEISVTGLQEDIDVFRISETRPTISLDAVEEEGEHEVEIGFAAVQGYSFEGTGNLTAKVTASKEQESSPEESGSEEEPTEKGTE